MVISAQPKTFGASFWTPAGLGKPNAVLDSLSAMMGAWRPGEEGGTAVVDIITGAVNPSGRLTHTWPAKAGQAHSVVSNSFHMPATRAGGQFAFTTGPAKPLFPFGSSPGPSLSKVCGGSQQQQQYTFVRGAGLPLQNTVRRAQCTSVPSV